MKALKLPMLFLLFISLSSMQCKKDETKKKDELPPETQSGKNTFGCLVNGEVWLPRAKFPYGSLRTEILSGNLAISVQQGGSSSIYFQLQDLNSEGDYIFKATNGRARYSADPLEYDLLEDGKITITKYDKTNKIIAGRFWITLKDTNGDSINITDGRFDLNYD